MIFSYSDIHFQNSLMTRIKSLHPRDIFIEDKQIYLQKLEKGLSSLKNRLDKCIFY